MRSKEFEKIKPKCKDDDDTKRLCVTLNEDVFNAFKVTCIMNNVAMQEVLERIVSDILNSEYKFVRLIEQIKEEKKKDKKAKMINSNIERNDIYDLIEEENEAANSRNV